MRYRHAIVSRLHAFPDDFLRFHDYFHGRHYLLFAASRHFSHGAEDVSTPFHAFSACKFRATFTAAPAATPKPLARHALRHTDKRAATTTDAPLQPLRLRAYHGLQPEVRHTCQADSERLRDQNVRVTMFSFLS